MTAARRNTSAARPRRTGRFACRGATRWGSPRVAMFSSLESPGIPPRITRRFRRPSPSTSSRTTTRRRLTSEPPRGCKGRSPLATPLLRSPKGCGPYANLRSAWRPRPTPPIRISRRSSRTARSVSQRRTTTTPSVWTCRSCEGASSSSTIGATRRTCGCGAPSPACEAWQVAGTGKLQQAMPRRLR